MDGDVVVEYLLLVQNADSFCDSVEAFQRLLAVDSTITFNGKRLLHASGFECDYAVHTDEIPGKNQRYFQLKLIAKSYEERDLDLFSELLKAIRSVMSRMRANPETLWDDISGHYSRNGYDIIHRIENLMRKLIANFMLITVGKEWADEAVPSEVKKAFKDSKRPDYINILHTVDFSHLADFLLKPYSAKSSDEILKQAAKATTLDDLTALKAVLPESNWKRYFSKLVDCQDSYLQSRWASLYELRCKVAHNAIVTKDDFTRIVALAGELETRLSDALGKLPQVKVPADELETVAEAAAGNVSSFLGDFIILWRNLERLMIYKAKECTPTIETDTGKKLTFFAAHQHLTKVGFLNSDQQSVIQQAQHMRNNIVHHTDVAFSEADILEVKEKLSRFYHLLAKISFSSGPDSDSSQCPTGDRDE